MPSKDKRITYNYRVSKAIERKMLLQAFQRLIVFGNYSTYQYVGMGAYYFMDFHLFHMSLGITMMKSIEWDEKNADRFRFNRPFNCIEIDFRESTDVIPELDYGTKTILWLDFDQPLKAKHLLDIKTFCSQAPSGSLIVVTVTAEPYETALETPGARLKRLQDRIGRDRVPAATGERDLPGWGTATVYRTIIDEQIREAINARNGEKTDKDAIRYKQLFNFNYSDGQKMLTVGGLMYGAEFEDVITRGLFDDLSFIRSDTEPYKIQVPVLTYREIQYLDTVLPFDGDQTQIVPCMPQEDSQVYKDLYRFLPVFVEAII